MHRMNHSEMVYNKIISFIETGYIFQLPLHLESKVTTMIYMRRSLSISGLRTSCQFSTFLRATDLRTERSKGVHDAAIQRRFQEVRSLFLAECPEGPICCGRPWLWFVDIQTRCIG